MDKFTKTKLDTRVPPILDECVRAAREILGNLSPAVPKNLLFLGDNYVFLSCPGSFVDRRVKLVVPAFAALLRGAVSHLLR